MPCQTRLKPHKRHRIVKLTAMSTKRPASEVASSRDAELIPKNAASRLDTDMAALVNHFNGSGKRPAAMRRKVCCDDGSD